MDNQIRIIILLYEVGIRAIRRRRRGTTYSYMYGVRTPPGLLRYSTTFPALRAIDRPRWKLQGQRFPSFLLFLQNTHSNNG